jgi:hypothetical protein
MAKKCCFLSLFIAAMTTLMIAHSHLMAVETFQSHVFIIAGTSLWFLRFAYYAFLFAGALFILYIIAALVLRKIPSRKSSEPPESSSATHSEPSTKYGHCPACGVIIPADATACDYCSFPLSPAPQVEPSATGRAPQEAHEPTPPQPYLSRVTLKPPARAEAEEPFTPVIKLPIPRLSLIIGFLIVYVFVIVVATLASRIYKTASEDFRQALPDRKESMHPRAAYGDRSAKRGQPIRITPRPTPVPEDFPQHRR